MINKHRFPDPLITTYVSPRYRMLLRDFRYFDKEEGTITCKKGLKIDGASFGRAFSVIFGDQHDYDIPATPHDQLYENNLIDGKYLTRKQCDKVFYRSMIDAGFPRIRSFIFYAGVRIGGWWPWWRNRLSNWWRNWWRDAKKRNEKRK